MTKFGTKGLLCGAAAVGAVAFGLGFGAQAAHATSISALVVNGVNSFQDTDGEIALRNIGTVANPNWVPLGTNGQGTTLQVGDLFVGAATFNTVNLVPVGDATSYDEIGTVFVSQIQSLSGTYGSPILYDTAYFGAVDAATWDAALGALGATFDSTNIDGAGQALLPNTMQVWYTDSKNNTDFKQGTNTEGAAINTVLDGTYAMSLGGVTNDTNVATSDGTSWSAQAPADVADFAGGTPLQAPCTTYLSATICPSYSIGLNVLQNRFPFDITNTQASLLGAGFPNVDTRSKQGAGLQYPETNFSFPVESDAGLVFNAVPEPGTLTLLGFGLLGMAAMRRKLKKAA